MYYNYIKFCCQKLIENNNLTSDNFASIDEVLEKITNLTIRPSITYGNNTDWTNIRREEDWILTFQIFVNHGNYIDLRDLATELRKTLIKYCCYAKFNNIVYTVDQINLNTTFEQSYQSISILLNVNSKEVI